MKQKSPHNTVPMGTSSSLIFFIIVLSYHSVFQILIFRSKCNGKTILLWRTGKFSKETERLKRYSKFPTECPKPKISLLLSTKFQALSQSLPVHESTRLSSRCIFMSGRSQISSKFHFRIFAYHLTKQTHSESIWPDVMSFH